jgi:hypothetical protein
MSSKNGSVPLSAIDFLGLAKRRKVARIDLGALGFEGVIYVRDLTAAEQSRITGRSGKNAKTRFYKDDSYEIDLAALTEGAGAKFVREAMVTDTQDGAILERAFEALGEDEDYITIDEDQLVQMADIWVREEGSIPNVEKRLGALSNIITNAVVKRVRELSGMVEDRVEEKKDNS